MYYSEIVDIESVYYPILAAIGVPVNLMAIVILSRGKCGLSKCITRYMVAMATADLSVLLIDVIFRRIADIYSWPTYLTYTPVCKIIHYLAPVAVDCSVWFTVAFTFDRFVAISTKNMKAKYCIERTASIVILTVTPSVCLQNLPLPFAYVPYIPIELNLGCAKDVYFYMRREWMVFSWIEQLFTPVIPFCLILLFNALTVRRISVASRVRRSLRDLSVGENKKDQEMVNRRRSVVLLLAISSSFILLWATSVAHFIALRCFNLSLRRSWTNHLFEFEKVGFMLQLLSSCTNTAIYTVTQRKFRDDWERTNKRRPPDPRFAGIPGIRLRVMTRDSPVPIRNQDTRSNSTT
ncbi:probable G-protein coupled receptor 139 [Amblyraja radiata]|uniref:probable G-protein coupled receptor 139 n=1 Tax=Amblyraja radiata TaxID=386614 RepID=UPI0014026620|nr:probable G-protein coupled receptor 139 [Amblyraja radiata]